MAGMLDLQALDNPAMQQVLLDDFVDIFPVYIGVPDTFRIDDDYRPFVTAVKTSCRVDPDSSLVRKPERLAALLGIVAHGLRIKALATGTTIRALVDTEKKVISIIVHKLKDTGRVKPCKARERTTAAKP
jgi:hypothetical protein